MFVIDLPFRGAFASCGFGTIEESCCGASVAVTELVSVATVPKLGRRIVRNVTTHLSTNNIAFTEGSVNEAVNFAVFNFRTNLEFAVGKKGFAGTVTAAQSVAINTLGLLVDETVLTAFRSLDIELIVDVMEVSVEIAPVIPINFVASTVHLVTIQQAA